MNVYLYATIAWILVMIVYCGMCRLYKDKSDFEMIPAFVIFLVITVVSVSIVSDINEQTLPEYKAGYSDFPDNTTYNEIIELEDLPNELRIYKTGWEDAKADSIKLKLENEMIKHV